MDIIRSNSGFIPEGRRLSARTKSRFSDAVCNPGGQRTGSVARRYEACGKNTDQVSRRQTEEIKSLPLRLIGCSRKEVEDEIRHYQDAPPLTELQQGLLRMELVSFSPQQIVVSKTYRKLQQAEAFFLQIEENRVIVYEEDSRVLYLQTAIDARTLPSGVRRQILNGWHGVSKAELEKFLVSQTET